MLKVDKRYKRSSIPFKFSPRHLVQQLFRLLVTLFEHGKLRSLLGALEAEIQRMQQAVSQSLSMQRCSVEENETLKDELTAERRKSAEQRAKLAVLEERYKRAEKLLRQLPKEMAERSKREYRET